jgi:acetyl-CoA carboxylase carboxyltransferase component
VSIIHRREIADADNEDDARGKLIADYEDRFANPYLAAERGLVDDVIEPRETRPRLIRAMEMMRNKRETMPPKKHGNIPL